MVTISGPQGSGKSNVAKMLYDSAREAGFHVVLVHDAEGVTYTDGPLGVPALKKLLVIEQMKED